MTCLDVLRIEIMSCSASEPPLGEKGEGSEVEVEEVDANAVSIKVISDMSRMVTNLLSRSQRHDHRFESYNVYYRGGNILQCLSINKHPLPIQIQPTTRQIRLP